MNRIIKAAIAAVAMGAPLALAAAPASAATITKPETITVVDHEAWTEEVKVVDHEAWTEEVKVVDHEAWTEEVKVVDHEAWTEHVPTTAVWASFSPTDPKKFTGTPTYPTDPSGTWIGGVMPDGHKGPDGVYKKGGGNGTWFYRQAGNPAYDIEHAEVSHIDYVQHEEESHIDYVQHEEESHIDYVQHEEESHIDYVQHEAVTHEETITTVLTDTNDPVASFDPATGTGVVVKDETTGENPSFSMTWTVVAHKEWSSTDNGGTRFNDVTTIYNVEPIVTPIIGDETDLVLGWNVSAGALTLVQPGVQTGDPTHYHFGAPYKVTQSHTSVFHLTVA